MYLGREDPCSSHPEGANLSIEINDMQASGQWSSTRFPSEGMDKPIRDPWKNLGKWNWLTHKMKQKDITDHSTLSRKERLQIAIQSGLLGKSPNIQINVNIIKHVWNKVNKNYAISNCFLSLMEMKTMKSNLKLYISISITLTWDNVNFFLF